MIKTVFDESGHASMWLREKSQKSISWFDNLKELMQAIQKFQNIMEFLDDMTFVLDK